jgi:tRNA(Ile2) C34 agmatinyltransferase TiaS
MNHDYPCECGGRLESDGDRYYPCDRCGNNYGHVTYARWMFRAEQKELASINPGPRRTFPGTSLWLPITPA